MSQSLFASLLAGSGLFVVLKRVESPPRDTEDPRSWLLISSPTTRQCPRSTPQNESTGARSLSRRGPLFRPRCGISHREKSGFPHPDRHRHGLNGGRDRPPTCLYDCRYVSDVAQAGGQRVDRQTDVVP